MELEKEMYILILFIVLALYYDLKKHRIPNLLNAAGAAIGFMLHIWKDGWEGVWFSSSGAAAGFSLFFFLYVARAVGAGDVKLFAAIGAIIGFYGVLQVAVYSLLLTFPVGIAVLLFRKRFLVFVRTMLQWGVELLVWRQRPNISGYEWGRIPFMIMVAPGAVLASPWMHESIFLFL
jgi:prepilin peptidase CpaA